MDKLTRILIADDQPMIRHGIKTMLEDQQQFVPILTEVEDGSEVMDKIHKTEQDVILMDIHMPKMDGISTARKLREKKIDTPILFMSAYEEENIIRQSLEIGVNGFILKSCGLEELTKAILTVKRNNIYYSNEIAQIILGASRKRKNTVGIEEDLTKREWQVIKLLAEEHSNDEIADQLGLSKRTVEGHRQNIKSKLNVKSTIGIIRFAYQNGHIN